MNAQNQLCVKLVHCGNVSMANPSDKEQKNIFFMPMGLIALADRLKKKGVDVEIVHSDLEAGKDIREILDFDTVDAVGMDLHWVNGSVVVLDTAELIKSINPGIFVFLGGFSASLFAEEIAADYPQVDAVIKGDAEVPIVELAGLLHEMKRAGLNPADGLDPAKAGKVRNLVYRAKDGKVTANEITYVGTKEEMEKLDFTAFHLLRNWEKYKLSSFFYTHFEPVASSPMFLLEASRGCQYSCTFCGGNSKAQKKMNNRTQTVFRSVDSCIETMKRAIALGFETFYTSMESEVSDEWFINLFERVKEENLEINYTYGCYRIPPPALVDAMAGSCKHAIIEISPETGIDEIRRQNKDRRIAYTNEEMEACLDYIAGKDNVKVQVFFGYYLAGDTGETILETIEYIVRLLVKYPGLLEIEYANFSTDPGSLFFFTPEKYNIDIKARNFNGYVRHLEENYVKKRGQQADMTIYKPKYISYEDDVEIRRKIRLLNYLFHEYRKSVSYLLKKTASPDVIVSILKGTHIAVTPDNSFPAAGMKEIFLTFCEKMGVLDDFLLKLILGEYEKLKADFRISKPTTQYYLEFDEAGPLEAPGDETTEAVMNYLHSSPDQSLDEKNLALEFNY